jgi:hypothetical protein
VPGRGCIQQGAASFFISGRGNQSLPIMIIFDKIFPDKRDPHKKTRRKNEPVYTHRRFLRIHLYHIL